MAMTFRYEEADTRYIGIDAVRGDEISIEEAQTFALLQIGNALESISSAIYNLSEEVQGLRSLEVELKK